MFFKDYIKINTDFINSSLNIINFYDILRTKNIKFNDLLLNISKDTSKMVIILKLLNINVIFFYELIEKIIKKHLYSERMFKYTIEYNLILILHVKNNLNNWKILQSLILCHNNYKSIYNQFLRWSKKDYFKLAFENYLNKNIEKINKDNVQIIDASACFNKYGSENIAVNPEYKKKKVTKISLLCDKNKVITSVCSFDLKVKEKKFKKKNIITFVHDSKSIQKTIDNCNKNIKINKIIADGGYKTKNIITSNKKTVKIITPNRKNQKNNLINDKQDLSIRYKVENIFGSLKLNNERIMLRKDRKIKHFMSWLYIGCLEHNIKILKC